jgi:hypothetical protein
MNEIIIRGGCSMSNSVLIIDKKILDDQTSESKIKSGNVVLTVKSRFDGCNQYKDLIYNLVSNKLKDQNKNV